MVSEEDDDRPAEEPTAARDDHSQSNLGNSSDIDSDEDNPFRNRDMLSSPLSETAMEGNLTVEDYNVNNSFQHTWEPPPAYKPKRGLSKYADTWKVYQPLRLQKRPKHSMPVDHCSLYSTMSYAWITGLMWRGYKNTLQTEDLYRCSPKEECYPNSQRLDYLWRDEIARHGQENASFRRAVWRFIATRFIPGIIILFMSLLAGFVLPTILLREVLRFAERPHAEAHLLDGLTLVLFMFLVEVARSLMFSLMWSINYRTALRLKGACMALVYRKILRVRSLGDKSIGEVINLISNDGTRVFDLVTLGPLILGGPIVAILGTAYVCWILGPTGLVGLGVIVVFYPLQYLMAKLIAYFRRKTVIITDERVRLMNDLLTNVKLIKLYCWERPFAANVADIRDDERGLLEKTGYIQSMSIAIAPSVAIIAAVATFLVYVAQGHDLTPAETFTAYIVYEIIRQQIVQMAYSRKYMASTNKMFNHCKV